VSAGAINALHLASFRGNLEAATADLEGQWKSLSTRQVFRSDPITVLRIGLRWAYTLLSGGTRLGPKAHSLVDTEPLRRFLRRAVDARGIEENIREGVLRAAAVSATSYQTGQTVTFVHGDPSLDMWERPHRRAVRDRLTVEHVMASSALPLLFPAERLDGHYYGDGSIRQSEPLAPAVHLGADRILAVSARYERSVREARDPVLEGYPPPAQVVGLLFNSIFLDTLDVDSIRLERINRLLERCGANGDPNGQFRNIDLLLLRPSRDLGRLASEFAGRLPRTIRYLVGGLGSRTGRTSDFVSYLLFEENYLSRLMELGEKDAAAQWDVIERFLGWGPPRATGSAGDGGAGDGGAG
jgi:NTE family protein